MNITGKVIRVNPVQSVGSNNFQKREAHIETESESKYPQIIAIEAQGEKVNLFDNLKPGDVADFAINLRGREWTSPDGVVKVFNTITAWKVDVKSGSQPAPIPTAPSTDIPF
jgi:single-strand DNA-binding protein